MAGDLDKSNEYDCKMINAMKKDKFGTDEKKKPKKKTDHKRKQKSKINCLTEEKTMPLN